MALVVKADTCVCVCVGEGSVLAIVVMASVVSYPFYS